MKKILIPKCIHAFRLDRFKLSLKLRLSIFFLVISTLGAFAENTYAQTKMLELDLESVSVGEALKAIEKQSEFHFFYSKNMIDVDREVTLNVNAQKIEAVLDLLFSGENVQYQIKDKVIVLSVPEENTSSQAQGKKVTGVVTDREGTPLPGVNIVEAGTTNGTITNINGEFEITVNSDEAYLDVSFIGFLNEHIFVGNQQTINIKLKEDVQSLAEVVIVGYGAQSRRNITGAVENVDSKELKDLPTMQVTQKLQGKISGVQINQTTGKLGEGMSIRVRGAASITAGSDPLYVVDGFPITGDIADINPDEIENITVLKDAASAAMYGSRAANGVVLITTKRAKQGQSNVSFSMYAGIQAIPEKGRPEMMNATQFATFKKEWYEENGQTVPEEWQNPEEYGEGTDWYDAVTRNAKIQNYSLSFNSSQNNFSSSIMASYFEQEGVIVNTNYERIAVRLNSDYKFAQWGKVGVNVGNTQYIKHGAETDGIWYNTSGVLQGAILSSPLAPIEDEEGNMTISTAGYGTVDAPNFLYNALNTTNNSRKSNVLANGFVELEPLPGLKFKSSIGVDMYNYSLKYFQPSTVGGFFSVGSETDYDRTTGGHSTAFAYSWLWENILTYDKSFGDHNFNFLVGYTTQNYKEETSTMTGTGYPDNEVQALSAATTITGSTANSEWSLLSQLARVNYDYKGKYIASLAIRRDGSSRFGTDNRWGSFPSASVGWVVTEEDFMKNLGTPVSFLKLRASYGVTGNNNIGNYTQYASMVSTNGSVNGSVANGKSLAGLNNTELGWENTTEIDLGTDIGIFNDRIFFHYDYYNRTTTDMLYTVDVPISSGFYNYTTNIGSIQFWGHELAVKTKNIVRQDFEWTTDANISFNRNKALNLGTADGTLYGDYTINEEGQPIGQLYAYQWLGLYENAEDLANSPTWDGAEVGTVKFADIDGDGVVEDGNDDRTVVGSALPKAVYGISTAVRYKNWDLSAVGSGAYGHQIFNLVERFSTNLDGSFNMLAAVENRWRSEEDPGEGIYGKCISGTTDKERDWVSSKFMYDASYFTIKNITLGYRVPVDNISFVSSFRLYLSIQQVYTFTKYPGNNPEVSSASGLNSGTDQTSYPIPRTFTVGLNVNF